MAGATCRRRDGCNTLGAALGLSEADTRAKLIDPAIHARGWTLTQNFKGHRVAHLVGDLLATMGHRTRVVLPPSQATACSC